MFQVGVLSELQFNTLCSESTHDLLVANLCPALPGPYVSLQTNYSLLTLELG